MGVNPLPGGMVQERARVLLHRKIAADHYLLRIHSPRAARRAEPGQFIHILCGEGSRGQSPAGSAPFLRRPLSLFDADPVRGFIEVIYKVVGLGTAALAQVPVGARVDFLGPLGRPFRLPGRGQTLFLVGGGVGIPPLYFVAKRIVEKQIGRGRARKTPARGMEIEALLGARTRGWVICASDFRRLGVRVGVATDDGTWGWRGSVVDLLRRRLRLEGSNGGTALCVCGPTPMMAAAAALARQLRIPAQVSLEERMGCAMGCCMGCVVEVISEPAGSHARFQRVCTEGPVFPAEAIRWRLH